MNIQYKIIATKSSINSEDSLINSEEQKISISVKNMLSAKLLDSIKNDPDYLTGLVDKNGAEISQDKILGMPFSDFCEIIDHAIKNKIIDTRDIDPVKSTNFNHSSKNNEKIFAFGVVYKEPNQSTFTPSISNFRFLNFIKNGKKFEIGPQKFLDGDQQKTLNDIILKSLQTKKGNYSLNASNPIKLIFEVDNNYLELLKIIVKCTKRKGEEVTIKPIIDFKPEVKGYTKHALIQEKQKYLDAANSFDKPIENTNDNTYEIINGNIFKSGRKSFYPRKEFHKSFPWHLSWKKFLNYSMNGWNKHKNSLDQSLADNFKNKSNLNIDSYFEDLNSRLIRTRFQKILSRTKEGRELLGSAYYSYLEADKVDAIKPKMKSDYFIATDENGKEMKITSSKIVYATQKDINGKPVKDKDGNPTYINYLDQPVEKGKYFGWTFKQRKVEKVLTPKEQADEVIIGKRLTRYYHFRNGVITENIPKGKDVNDYNEEWIDEKNKNYEEKFKLFQKNQPEDYKNLKKFFEGNKKIEIK